MARLERESSNSFNADLFDILEDWDRYLKQENIDFEELFRCGENLVEGQPNSADTSQKQPSKSKGPRPVHRFTP